MGVSWYEKLSFMCRLALNHGGIGTTACPFASRVAIPEYTSAFGCSTCQHPPPHLVLARCTYMYTANVYRPVSTVGPCYTCTVDTAIMQPALHSAHVFDHSTHVSLRAIEDVSLHEKVPWQSPSSKLLRDLPAMCTPRAKGAAHGHTKRQ